MNIVYFIGNGFDINLGLKTKYRDFYKEYLKMQSSNDTIKIFKEELDKNKDIETWADLEVVLGDYAKNFDEKNIDEYRSLLFDIQDSLIVYLKNQEKDLIISEQGLRKLNEDLFRPYLYLTPREQSEFKKYKNSYGQGEYFVNVASFNYTLTFEKLYSFDGTIKRLGTHTYSNNTYPNSLQTVEHIHGTLDSNMILGVNDEAQINNDKLRNNKKITRVLVKPLMNKNAGTLRDERCIANIENANVICIFGMSMGETDKFWWKKIAEKLCQGNTTLIIFSLDKNLTKQRGYLDEEEKEILKNRFISYSQLTPQQREIVLNKIFICFNSEMFSIQKSNEEQNIA